MSNVTDLYNDCKGILYKFANQFNVDISVCEIAFMQAVNHFDEHKGANFKTFLTYYVKGACLAEKRSNRSDKRKANQQIVDYNIEWLGVKPRESLIGVIKKSLTPDEWNLVYNRYYLGYKQREIAKQQGVTQVTISRQLQTIYKKLKGAIA